MQGFKSALRALFPWQGMITVYETLRVCRSAAPQGPCPLLARHPDDAAGHGHCGSRPVRVRPERGVNPAQRPLLVSGLGAVLGMDWHSSGITTAVMGALKRGLNPRAHELGMYICGGRGKYSRMTPHELLTIADKHGLQGDALVRYSRLTAKVDNTAIQDGFQLYLHAFVVTIEGEWAVIQQGMNAATRTARRYHWHSRTLRSFTEEPHVAVVGDSQGEILNLVHRDAVGAQQGIVGLLREDPGYIAKSSAAPGHAAQASRREKRH